jgi:hypothetical protein
VIRSALTGDRPQVRAFLDWLVAEARTAMEAEGAEAEPSPSTRARRGGATTAAAPRNGAGEPSTRLRGGR